MKKKREQNECVFAVSFCCSKCPKNVTFRGPFVPYYYHLNAIIHLYYKPYANFYLHFNFWFCLSLCVCVCACVCCISLTYLYCLRPDSARIFNIQFGWRVFVYSISLSNCDFTSAMIRIRSIDTQTSSTY